MNGHPIVRKTTLAAGLALLPAALLLREISFRHPHATERLYGQRIYPMIARFMGWLNGLVAFSMAEVLILLVVLGGAGLSLLWWARRPGPDRPPVGVALRLRRWAARMWITAGFLSLAFLFLWGFNYARPSLETRMELVPGEVRGPEVLEAGRRCARSAASLRQSLGIPDAEPSRLPMDFATLNRIIDERLRTLRLPGDPIQWPTSPAKPLASSPLISYLGLSGIFIPFTGEPSFNALVPDVSIPLVVAHERAHQRGITDEGEANLVAFLVCSGARDAPYLRYTAYLYAAARLIGAASDYLPEQAAASWQDLGEGGLRDLAAIRDFWSRYEGPAAEMADRINDRYLRAFRVPDGVESYARIVELLVALDRQGRLAPEGLGVSGS